MNIASNIDYKKAIIKSDYQELLYEEYPYLFIGKNSFGNIIIGSFADDNEINKEEIYYHILAKEQVLLAYFNQKISYLELMRNENTILYEIKKGYDRKIIGIRKISFLDIPEDIRPMDISFYLLEKPLLICQAELKRKKINYITRYIQENNQKNYVSTDNQLLKRVVYQS